MILFLKLLALNKKEYKKAETEFPIMQISPLNLQFGKQKGIKETSGLYLPFKQV